MIKLRNDFPQTYQAGEPYPIPEAFHNRLRDDLRARWNEKFGNS